MNQAFKAISNSTITAAEAARNLGKALGTVAEIAREDMNKILEAKNESVLFRSDGTEAIRVSVEFEVHDYDHHVHVFINGKRLATACQPDDFSFPITADQAQKGWYRVDVDTPASFTVRVWRGESPEVKKDTKSSLADSIKSAKIYHGATSGGKMSPGDLMRMDVNGLLTTVVGIRGQTMEVIPAEYQPIYTAQSSSKVADVCTSRGEIRINDTVFERDPHSMDLIVVDSPARHLIGHRVHAKDIHETETGITMNIRYEEV
jgi:hypothetical protein